MWTKISDDFFRHPKVVSAGRDARDLYLVALAHCNEHLTDGFVAATYLRRLAADAEIDDAPASAHRLVEVGLWEEAEGGWRVHGFADYNPTRAEVEAERAKTAERVGNWRKARRVDVTTATSNAVGNTVCNGVTPPVTNGVGTPSPGPGPGSVPEDTEQAPLPPRSKRRGGRPASLNDLDDDPSDPALEGSDQPARASDHAARGAEPARPPGAAQLPIAERPLPLLVQDALTGCPAHWEPALRDAWQRCEESDPQGVRDPSRLLSKILNDWKAGHNPPPEPLPPPTPRTPDEIRAAQDERRRAEEDRRRIEEDRRREVDAAQRAAVEQIRQGLGQPVTPQPNNRAPQPGGILAREVRA